MLLQHVLGSAILIPRPTFIDVYCRTRPPQGRQSSGLSADPYHPWRSGFLRPCSLLRHFRSSTLKLALLSIGNFRRGRPAHSSRMSIGPPGYVRIEPIRSRHRRGACDILQGKRTISAGARWVDWRGSSNNIVDGRFEGGPLSAGRALRLLRFAGNLRVLAIGVEGGRA